MKKTMQRIVQIVSLALFVFLFIKGKIQVWMIIFLG
jgi:ferredoxin-type protein NapH